MDMILKWWECLSLPGGIKENFQVYSLSGDLKESERLPGWFKMN